MDSTIKEIAAVLHSTESMAAQFVQRVQERVDQPVSHADILIVMQKIPPKSLSLEKVITRVKERQKRGRRGVAQRPAAAQKRHSPIKPASITTTAPPSNASVKEPKTILERLEVVLQKNWDRAETEGLQPARMSTDDFVNAVYRYTDRREASRQRILQAARQLDQDNVLLTPALVADIVHQLFES